MRKQTSNVSGQLKGDWTINGVVRQIPPLMALSDRWDRNFTSVDIDCSGIEGIDICGFQLLYTWLHCLEISGIRSNLVNLPEFAKESQYRLGLTDYFHHWSPIHEKIS